MAVKKISIALHPDIAAALTQSARMQELSVSTWLEQAAQAKLRNEAGMTACDEYERGVRRLHLGGDRVGRWHHRRALRA